MSLSQETPTSRDRGDTLNDILIECCRLRGVYPLMHRTLNEFNWFCSSVIFGAREGIDQEILAATEEGVELRAETLRSIRDEENGLQQRFKGTYYDYSDGLELIRLAEAFRIYCREEYAPNSGEEP